MRKTLKLFLTGLLLSIVMAIPVFADEIIPIPIEVEYRQTDARSILKMINDFRHSDDAWYWNKDNTTKTEFSNLQDMHLDPQLEKLAMTRAAEIAVWYDHSRPNGESSGWEEMKRNGYSSFGENIAKGMGYPSPVGVFNAWKEDSANYSGQGHRRNMLDPNFNAVGIGCCVYRGIYCWVQVFTKTTNSGAMGAADDSVKTVIVQVDDSYITRKSFAIQASEIGGQPNMRLEVPNMFPEATIKGVSALLAIQPSLSTGNSKIATIENNRIHLIANGETYLEATVTILGETFTERVPIIVSGEPYVEPEEPSDPSNPSGKTDPGDPSQGGAASVAGVGDGKVSNPGKGKVKVTWTAVKGAKGYEIQIAKDAAFKKQVKTYTSKKANKTIKLSKAQRKRFKKKFVYVRIRAFSKNDAGKKVYGAWSSAAKVKLKKA